MVIHVNESVNTGVNWVSCLMLSINFLEKQHRLIDIEDHGWEVNQLNSK